MNDYLIPCHKLGGPKRVFPASRGSLVCDSWTREPLLAGKESADEALYRLCKSGKRTQVSIFQMHESELFLSKEKYSWSQNLGDQANQTKFGQGSNFGPKNETGSQIKKCTMHVTAMWLRLIPWIRSHFSRPLYCTVFRPAKTIVGQEFFSTAFIPWLPWKLYRRDVRGRTKISLLSKENNPK